METIEQQKWRELVEDLVDVKQESEDKKYNEVYGIYSGKINHHLTEFPYPYRSDSSDLLKRMKKPTPVPEITTSSIYVGMFDDKYITIVDTYEISRGGQR